MADDAPLIRFRRQRRRRLGARRHRVQFTAGGQLYKSLPFDDVLGLAEQASVNVGYRLDDSSLNLLRYC
jgi:hypothetical protein